MKEKREEEGIAMLIGKDVEKLMKVKWEIHYLCNLLDNPLDKSEVKKVPRVLRKSIRLLRKSKRILPKIDKYSKYVFKQAKKSRDGKLAKEEKATRIVVESAEGRLDTCHGRLRELKKVTKDVKRAVYADQKGRSLREQRYLKGALKSTEIYMKKLIDELLGLERYEKAAVDRIEKTQ